MWTLEIHKNDKLVFMALTEFTCQLSGAVWASELRALCCCSVVQLCPPLCDPMDCSPPGSSVHVVLQARILEWVAIPFSRGVFLTQGLNPRLLHWQADFFTIELPGEPPNHFEPRFLACCLYIQWKLRWKPQPAPCPSSVRRPSGQLTPPPPSCLTKHPVASIFPLKPLDRPFPYILCGLNTKSTVHLH